MMVFRCALDTMLMRGIQINYRMRLNLSCCQNLRMPSLGQSIRAPVYLTTWTYSGKTNAKRFVQHLRWPRFSDPHRLENPWHIVLSIVGIFFVTLSPILFLNLPNDERCRTIYVPGAEMKVSVDIDIDKFEQCFNAQCIQ